MEEGRENIDTKKNTKETIIWCRLKKTFKRCLLFKTSVGMQFIK